ncbi:hypothetical protein Tco_0084113 [Tanacetum coccineum]
MKIKCHIQRTQYAVFKIWNQYNILEDIKRGPYSKKYPIRRNLDNSTNNVLIPLDSWTSGLLVKTDDLNTTMEEYIRLEEEKSRRHGKVFNWETATYGKIWDNKDVHDLGSVETEFPAIVFNETLTSKASLSCESTNDNDKVNMPLLPSPNPTVSYFNDLDYFNDFENEFPAIIYSDALTTKSDLLTEPILNPQHIDEFNSKGETSLFECDEEEQNVLYFNDLFSFNVIYPDDSKSDEDNDDDKIDIKHSSRDLSVKPLRDLIKTDVGAYAHGVLYKVEDIATCLIKYVKFWDDWEVDRYGNANLGDLDNLTNNVLIPLDSWTSRLLVYRFPLSGLRMMSHLSLKNDMPLRDKLKIDNPNITIEECIRLQEEKSLSRAIVLDDTSREALSWEPTVSPLNDNEIDFRISFDESDDKITRNNMAYPRVWDTAY